jgi:hypothetical protein
MQLIMTEQDFRRALGNEGVNVSRRAPRRYSRPRKHGLSNGRRIAACNRNVQRMIPEEFEVLEITLKVTLSGTPFGVGIGGDTMIKFGPEKSS